MLFRSGQKVFDLANPADRLALTGGYGAGADGTLMHLDECGGYTLGLDFRNMNLSGDLN